jgi:hypothetical protein
MTKNIQPKLILLLIFIGLGANSIFNSLAFALGFQYPFTTFVFIPADLFADFFKVIFSFPHEGAIEIHQGKFHDLLKMYLSGNNPYGGIQAVNSGNLSHFHMPPLSALFSLISAQLMVFIDPLHYYGLILLFMLAAIFYTFRSLNCSRVNLFTFIAAFILSYPFIFAVTRGNVYSIISGITVISFLILSYKYDKSRGIFMLFLLAIAINIKPNLIIFIFALLVNDGTKIIKKNLIFDIGIFLMFSAGIFATSLIFANILYPDYSLSNFLTGLKIYHSLYVIGNGGLAFGSSLFGALKFIFKSSPHLEIITTLICFCFFTFFTKLYLDRIITKVTYIYILCVIYTLGSPVFGDYHLIVFFAPLVLAFIATRNKLDANLPPTYKLVFISSILMLVPKNIFFMNGISLQIIFNPLILLSSLFVIYFLNTFMSKSKIVIQH